MTTAETRTCRTVVTFGWDHIHPVSGLRLHKHYVVVTGVDYEHCRQQTIARFGNRWAFDYIEGAGHAAPGRSAEDQAGVEQYNLTEVDIDTGELVG